MTARPCRRTAFQDTLPLDLDAPRVIALPPSARHALPARRELSTRVGLLAALVIVGCLLYIAHDDTPPADPAMGTAALAKAQG